MKRLIAVRVRNQERAAGRDTVLYDARTGRILKRFSQGPARDEASAFVRACRWVERMGWIR